MGVWSTLKKAAGTVGGYAVGGPIGAVLGSGAAKSVGGKLWGGVKSTVGGQASFTPTAQNLDQRQANIDLGYSNQVRGRQGNLANALQRRVAGQAPSVAALQGQAGIAQAFQNASRIAANARGVNRGLALRSGAEAASTGMAQANRDATMLRAQEQVAAEQTLGQQLAQQRAQDLQQRAGSLQAAQANQQAQLGAQQLQTELANANATRAQKGTGAALSFVGPLIGAMASDIRVKQDLAPVNPYSYTYKPEMAASMAEQLAAQSPPEQRDAVRGMAYADARSPRIGVMTQELKKSKGGKKTVVDTPAGQAIEGRRALSFVLANQAGLDKRLRRIEGDA